MLITDTQKSFSIGLCRPSPLLHVTVKPPVAGSQGCEVSGRDCVQHKGSWVWPDFHNFLLGGFVSSLTPMYSVEMILCFVRWGDSRPWRPSVLWGRGSWISWGSVQAAGISTSRGRGWAGSPPQEQRVWKPPQLCCPHCLESNVKARLQQREVATMAEPPLGGAKLDAG